MKKQQHTDNSTERFPDELQHLEKVGGCIDDALAAATAAVARLDKEYTEMKHYMVQGRGELDPHEMFQNELGLKQIDASGAFAVDVRDKLNKIKDSPYFARIDFRKDTDDSADIFYIGRFAFRHEGRLLVSDWRAPVAGMFYDCEPGPAGYDAPAGKIQGELTRKRQFKITNGAMEYALESAVNIQDDVLQKELSHTSDEKMKSIIATIQKEQNQIIRDESTGTLIIQGAPGSGKTSIALHRIAFLLYRFKSTLSARNISIISPNKVFGDYIANVLPELGEELVYGVSLADIAGVQLDGILHFEADKDPLAENGTDWEERLRLKSTLDFVKQLDAFICQIPNLVFVPADYAFGRFSITAEQIAARFCAYAKHPVKQRLRLTADDIHERFCTENWMGDEVPKKQSILKALHKMLTVKNTLELYKAFYRQNGMEDKFVMPAKKTLEWADVYPFLYVHAAFDGLHESGVIRHLVVDEMQDYTPVQFAVLNLLFKCPKTILGDFGQRIHPNHLHTLEDIRQLYREATFAELCKSYRSSYEIISFAKQIKCSCTPGTIEAIARHGKAPCVIGFPGAPAELAALQKAIAGFAQSGYASLGIITKTNADAKRLFDLLAPRCGVHLLLPESTHFVSGAVVTSVQMAKGLEFDEVIVPGVNSENYHTEYDGSLLYIACTRAMHRLSLLYTGAPSPLIPTGV